MASKSTEALNEEAAGWFARLQNSAAPESVVREFERWMDADPARAVGEETMVAEHGEARAQMMLRKREADVGADAGGFTGADDDDG